MKIAWPAFTFLLVSHVSAILGTFLYGISHGFTWTSALIGLSFLFLTTFSIGAGYHRLFTHGAYQAHVALRMFLAFFGAASFEGSILKWATLHRRHHQAADTEDDPHNRSRGFGWSHWGWVMHEYTPTKIEPNVDDLKRDWVVMIQDRFYAPIAILSGLALPTYLGYLWGDPVGGLVIGGLLRMVVFHQITFSINSLAHTIGTKTYSQEGTARDSIWTALLTMGEGYHNYHHAHPYDYRNGPRWRDYDPTKWFIFLLSKIGLARKLVRREGF